MKKPMFKPIMMDLRGPDGQVYKVRATDARELTAEQAISRMGTAIREASEMKDLTDSGLSDWIWRTTGYSARVVNGKVRVRMANP